MSTMLMLATYLHDLNPIALPIHGSLAIRWYGLSYLAGFFLAYLMMRWAVKRGRSTLSLTELTDMVLWLSLGAVIGGRVGYAIFYDPKLFLPMSQPPYWGLLAMHQGGMASHGGIIGVILACGLYARKHRHRWAHVLDMAALGTPLGLFCGRIANFINGELFGRPCSPDFPLAVKFPQEIHQWGQFHPEKLDSLLPVLGLLSNHGQANVSYSARLDQLVLAVQQGNAPVRQAIEPLLTPRHPSQLYAAVAEGLVVLAVLLIVWSKPKRPLVLSGAFAVSYSLMRIVDEFFRMPDAQIIHQEFARWHVSRGQLLSAFLLLAGIAMLALNRHRPLELPAKPQAPITR